MIQRISARAVEAEAAPRDSGALPPVAAIVPVGARRARWTKQMLLTVSTGYILMYFSELVFWSSYDPEGMAPWPFALTWGGYSIVAYGFLAIVHYFRVHTIWSLFIAGAAYGWVLEGIFAQTLYGTAEFALPVTVSWTGLAWHALISVLAGWYAIRKTLLRNDCCRTIAVASLLGIFYGAWALLWTLEPGHRVAALVGEGRKDVALIHFALYSLLTTVILVLSYWAYNAAEPAGFRPSPVVVSVLGGMALVYFALAVVPVRPLSSLLLPVLLGMAYVALRKNRASRPHRDLVSGLYGCVRVNNYLCLLFMPLVASALYGLGLAADVRIPTGVFILVVSTCAGAVMLGVSMVKVLRSEKEGHNVVTGTTR